MAATANEAAIADALIGVLTRTGEPVDPEVAGPYDAAPYDYDSGIEFELTTPVGRFAFVVREVQP